MPPYPDSYSSKTNASTPITPKSATTLITLPPEIPLLIIHHLPSPLDRIFLALTSKHFHRLVLSVIGTLSFPSSHVKPHFHPSHTWTLDNPSFYTSLLRRRGLDSTWRGVDDALAFFQLVFARVDWFDVAYGTRYFLGMPEHVRLEARDYLTHMRGLSRWMRGDGGGGYEFCEFSCVWYKTEGGGGRHRDRCVDWCGKSEEWREEKRGRLREMLLPDKENWPAAKGASWDVLNSKL